MAIKVNQVDIKSVMCPAVSGVRSEAQAVRIYNGSAWVDVWSSMKLMTLLSNSITKGTLVVYDTGAFQYSKLLSSGVGTMAGGGTMIFYLDGEWVNPTITFNYTGGVLYEKSTNVYSTTTAGTISIYHRVKGATSAGTTVALSRMGVDYTGSDFEYESGSVSKTLTGTYDRLGLSIAALSYSWSYSFASMIIEVSDVKFGTQKIGFPASAEFSYQDY